MTVVGFLIGLPFGALIGLSYAILILNNILGIALVFPPQLAQILTPLTGPLTSLLAANVLLSLLLFIIVLIIHTLFVLLPYFFASLALGPAPAGAITANQGEWFSRGWMMGINWATNAVLVFPLLFFADPLFVAAVFGVQFLAVIPPISQNPFFQPFVGWFGWILPLSFLVSIFGILIFIANLVMRAINPAPITLPANFPIAPLAGNTLNPAISSITIDFTTGCIVMHGGFFTINPGAYNMGNILFVHTSNTGAGFANIVLHETGHTLNASVFGAPFHIINAVDQNIFPGRGPLAYAEIAAESHRRNAGSTFIDLW